MKRKFLSLFGLATLEDLNSAKHVSRIHQAHLADALNTTNSQAGEIARLEEELTAKNDALVEAEQQIAAHIETIDRLEAERNNFQNMATVSGHQVSELQAELSLLREKAYVREGKHFVRAYPELQHNKGTEQ